MENFFVLCVCASCDEYLDIYDIESGDIFNLSKQMYLHPDDEYLKKLGCPHSNCEICGGYGHFESTYEDIINTTNTIDRKTVQLSKKERIALIELLEEERKECKACKRDRKKEGRKILIDNFKKKLTSTTLIEELDNIFSTTFE